MDVSVTGLFVLPVMDDFLCVVSGILITLSGHNFIVTVECGNPFTFFAFT
jgi:hypothetical protein